MHRYKNSAERSFYRSLNALQQLRKHYLMIEREKERLKKELAASASGKARKRDPIEIDLKRA